MNTEDAVLRVMRAFEQDAQLHLVEVVGEVADVAGEFERKLGLGRFRLGFAQFDHDLEVFEPLLGLEERVDAFAERGGLVDDLLGGFADVPERLGGHQRIQFSQAFLRAGDVKETSGDE